MTTRDEPIEQNQKRCDHKFVDSKRCLKCGWQPFCGRLKYSHDDSCCPKDPNLKVQENGS